MDLHIKAFLTNFEIVCEASIIALVSDLGWLLHDVSTNGLSVWYVLVGLGLILGIVGTVYGLVRHHNHYTHRLLKKFKRR